MNWSRIAVWEPQMLSVLRLVSGLIFMEHGTAKWLNFPPSPNHPPLASMAGVGGLMEFVGGILLILGLFTRPVAFLLSGEMAVAYFMVHFKRGFFPVVNRGELAATLCFVFFYLFAAGAGPHSVDADIRRRAPAR